MKKPEPMQYIPTLQWCVSYKGRRNGYSEKAPYVSWGMIANSCGMGEQHCSDEYFRQGQKVDAAEFFFPLIVEHLNKTVLDTDNTQESN